MATVFFSYTHVDEDLRNKLEIHLTMLKRQGFIEAWHDRRIAPGDQFDHAISAALERADIILLLVSAEFLASAYCYETEMTRAMERQQAGTARVVPIILRPCDWHDAPFGKLMALPRDGKAVTTWPNLDEAFSNITQGLKGLVKPAKAAPAAVVSTPRATPPVGDPVARSSNLAIKKTFSQADKDEFLEGAFEFMGRFFTSSLDELKARNEGVRTNFRQVDANTFTATIYLQGAEKSACTVRLGNQLGKGITYSHGSRASDNSFNEIMTVEADAHSIHLKMMGMSQFGSDKKVALTPEGAAEYYWGLLLEPLTR